MRTVAVVCAIAASAFIVTPVRASLCVLDQFQVNQNYSYAVGDSTLMAQTFTAGLTGVLCHIEIGNTSGISWGDASPPVVEIRDTITVEGQRQPGSLLGSGSVTLSDPVPSNGWTLPISFLAQGIDVTAGQIYSIVLWASDQPAPLSESVSVGATKYDSYGAGALWAYDAGTWWLLSSIPGIPVYDMQFQTYVQAVPLPAGIWLGIFAVSVAGWHLKRQRA